MKKRTVIQYIALALVARRNCLRREGKVAEMWADKWESCLEDIERNYLLSGSGFDQGTTIDRDRSMILQKPPRVILCTSYHHMTEGVYDGWTDHEVIVTPDFDGINLRVTGRNRNDIKHYIAEQFHHVLMEEIDHPLEEP